MDTDNEPPLGMEGIEDLTRISGTIAETTVTTMRESKNSCNNQSG